MNKIVLTLMLLSFTGNAQWVQMSNGMGSLPISSLAVSGNNLFAGATSKYGVFLSTNNGSSWTQTSLNIETVYSLAVNTNYVFAGLAGAGVFLTTNSGTNWTQTSLNNLTVWSLAAGSNYILAGIGSSGGIFRSTDNGTSWIRTLNNRTILSLAVNGNYVFAGTYVPYGIYLSTNSGINWALTSFNSEVVLSLAVNLNYIFAGTNTNVFLSTNTGTSWNPTSLNTGPVYSLLVNGNNVFAGVSSPYSFYVTYNSGASWTQRNEGLSNRQVNSLCILNNYIFAGTAGGGVYRRLLGELVGIEPKSNEIPRAYKLYQNYPNPFNPSTKIWFSVPALGNAYMRSLQLVIYDILGREITTLVNEELKAGTYEVEWDGSNYPSGVYYYRLISDNYAETKKMVLIK